MFVTIQNALQTYSGLWKDKKGVQELSITIAERKALLSTKKIIYSAKIKVDNTAKIVNFSEMLIEAGSGSGAREDNIEEQSDLFGKKFDYKFDYKEIRSIVENTVTTAGYEFKYQILPVK